MPERVGGVPSDGARANDDQPGAKPGRSGTLPDRLPGGNPGGGGGGVAGEASRGAAPSAAVGVMAKRGASLIEAAAAAEAAAPALSFFSEVEEAEKRLAQAGEFTGERLHRDRPEIYQAIVRMTAEGLSISATARALRVSRNTVCAVREREAVPIEQEKKEVLNLLRKGMRLGAERTLELLPETKSAKDAALVTAIMADKHQLLSGEATSRIERVEARPDQVRQYLDSLPVIEAEIVDGEIATGIAGQIAGQKGTDAPAAVPLLSAPISDMGSDDAGVANSVDAQTRATPRATQVNTPPPPRGGGGHEGEYPHPQGMNTEKQNFGQRGHDDLCKRTAKKKPGASTQARTTKKKKGGSGC